MKVVAVKGGLGNQMFQYAFYRALQNRGERVKADISSYTHWQQHNGYELEKLFGIELDFASEAECIACGFPKKGILSKVSKKLDRILGTNRYIYYTYGNQHNARELKRIYKIELDFASEAKRLANGHHKGNLASKALAMLGLISDRKRYIYVEGAPAIQYLPQLLENLPEDCYFDGYWQSERYFEEVADDVRSSFRFSEDDLGDTNKALLEQMRQTNSVSLHVRRGDYVGIEWMANICTLDGYYAPAVDYIRQREQDLHFFVFSNDIAWCRENLALDNCCYVDNNSGAASYRDMQLMSACKHNIIANSTFSWWAAWLNDNPHKLVLTPPHFFNSGAAEHNIPPSWIKIDRPESVNKDV